MFFAFSHFNNLFGTHDYIPAIFNFLDLMLSALSHSQSPQHPKTYLQRDLRLSEGKTMITNHIFFLEILKAVCLRVDLVQKLIQEIFPKMEQKLVQRCETEIVANACNASY